jgi:hypothetical protein
LDPPVSTVAGAADSSGTKKSYVPNGISLGTPNGSYVRAVGLDQPQPAVMADEGPLWQGNGRAGQSRLQERRMHHGAEIALLRDLYRAGAR